ncbi:MAG: hypothetical protein ACFFDN_00880 [Candidatus Hodarchaeota archaeon]
MTESILDPIGRAAGNVGTFLSNLVTAETARRQRAQQMGEERQLFPTALETQRQQLEFMKQYAPLELQKVQQEIAQQQHMAELYKQYEPLLLEQAQAQIEKARADARKALIPEFKSKAAQQIFEHQELAHLLPADNKFLQLNAARLERALAQDPNATVADKAFAQQNAKAYTDYMSGVSASAEQADKGLQELQNFQDAYNSLKHPVFSPSLLGRPWTNLFARLGYKPSQQELAAIEVAEKSSANLQLELLKTIKNFRSTNSQLSFLKTTLMDAQLQPLAVENRVKQLRAVLEQQKLRPYMMNALKARGITDTNIMKFLWQMYSDQFPVLGAPVRGERAGTFVPSLQLQNLERWVDFVTPEAIAAAKAGHKYIPSRITPEVEKALRARAAQASKVRETP